MTPQMRSLAFKALTASMSYAPSGRVASDREKSDAAKRLKLLRACYTKPVEQMTALEVQTKYRLMSGGAMLNRDSIHYIQTLAEGKTL